VSERHRHEYDIAWRMSVEVEVPDAMDPESEEAYSLASLKAADLLRESGPQVEDVEYLGPVDEMRA
jgi:hypothetical protein